MKGRLNIAVCGCGPAGLAVAILLHRHGHSVRVFEQFDKPRPVGSGLILQPPGLAVLHEMGLRERVASLGARIDRLFGKAAPSQRIVLDVQYHVLGTECHALAVHRAALFDTLHECAVANGIGISPSTLVSGAHETDQDVSLLEFPGRPLGKFDLVVDALGAGSSLAAGIAPRRVLPYGALWTNVPWPEDGPVSPNALEQRYRRASGMAGLLPIGRRAPGEPALAAFFWSLKRAHFSRWRENGIAAWKAEIGELWPEVVPALGSITDPGQVTFAQYGHFTASKPYSRRIVHIGDAAHTTSPQLGQGANMALLDALALVRAIERNEVLADALRDYAGMRYWHVRLFQWASAALTPFYQSDSRSLPVLRDWLVAPLSRVPVVRSALARLVSGMAIAPLRGAQIP